jgi:hypothetical protein
MPNARVIPIVNLEPDQKLSADQIVLVANGDLTVLADDGEKVGTVLKRKDRSLLMAAVALGYLTYSTKQTHLVEVFGDWCDAKEIPCVSFEIENDCLDILNTNDPVETDDPFVTMHFDVTTAGRPFTKAGLLAVTDCLLGDLWDLALSPWKISAGVIPFSDARQILAEVYKVWDTTSEPKAESGSSTGGGLGSFGFYTVQ